MVDGAVRIRPVLFLWIVSALFFNCAKYSEIEILAQCGNATITKTQFEQSYGEWMLFSREFDSQDTRKKYLEKMLDDLLFSKLFKEKIDDSFLKLIRQRAVTQATMSLHDYDNLEISENECRKVFQDNNQGQIFITESDFQMSLPSIRQELRMQKMQKNRHFWVEKIMGESQAKINRNLIKANEKTIKNAMAIRRGDFVMVQSENSEINFSQNIIQIENTNWDLTDLLEKIRFAPVSYSKENTEHCLAMLIRDEVVFQHGISADIHKLPDVQKQIEWQKQRAQSELFKIAVADSIADNFVKTMDETTTQIQFQKQVENRLKKIVQIKKNASKPTIYYEKLEQCFDS